MTALKNFLVTTLLGGFVILVPLLVIYLIIGELFDLVIQLGRPISELFPDDSFALLGDPFWVSLLMLVLLAFACGLALHSHTLLKLGHWLEQRTFGRLAIYRAVKGLAHGMLGSEHQQRFRPALWSYNEHCQQLVYLMEGSLPAAADAKLTILVPDAPGGFSGSVMQVDASQLHPIQATIGEVSGVLAQWGVGMETLLSRPAAGD